MKDKILDIINAWGPWILTLFIPSGVTVTAGIFFNWNIYVLVSVAIIVFFIIILLICIFWDSIVAKYYQWKYGRISGLWTGKNLDKEIYKCFISSSIIRIKVTRGTDLFNEKNSINIIDELRKLKDDANAQNPKTVQVLLIAPCFKIKHVQDRYNLHKGKYRSEQEFLNSWKKTIEELSAFQTEDFKISVRFYSGNHSRWRFYICSGRKDEKQIILLNKYDDNTFGPETPMYKIIKSEKNIGAFMDRYFDEIWCSSIKLTDYIRFVKDGKCVRLFCEECKNNKDITDGYCKSDCTAANCSHHNNCIERVNQWDTFYSGLWDVKQTNLNL